MGSTPASKRITVTTDDGIVPFDYISQGTISLIGWVGVVLQRLYEIYGADGEPTDRFVLLLIDELDVHMHPSWQQTLIRNVTALFPGLQLIATRTVKIFSREQRASQNGCLKALRGAGFL